jgi:hypothetical protein
MMDHTNPSVASVQGGDGSLYYEISSMEGSDDTWEIVRISGSGAFHRLLVLRVDAEICSGLRLDLEGYPRFANLAKNATSIRIFHLGSIEAREGKPSCSEFYVHSHKWTFQPSTILSAFSRDAIHPQ